MKCQRCTSTRVATLSSKSSDMNDICIGEENKDGYVPSDMGIGGGDYVRFDWCLDCGQLQGEFPLPETSLESGRDDE